MILTPKTINFPFVQNGKLMVFACPNTLAHQALDGWMDGWTEITD